MTPKYQTDISEFIHSLSSRKIIVRGHSLFKIGSEKIEDYDTKEIQASQLNYFRPDHTHYCLNCRDWYPSQESVFECKLQHATVSHNEHVIYCVRC
jgi:hypothetical protein